MFAKKHFFIISLSMILFSCKDENPAGPSGEGVVFGTWYAVSEKWEWSDEDGSGSEYHTFDGQVELIMKITASEVTTYSNLGPDSPDPDEVYCYHVSDDAYTGSINEAFNDSETSDEGTSTWKYTFTLSGDELIIAETDTYASGGWEVLTTVWKKYSGMVPPSDWPSENCTYLDKRARGHLGIITNR